MMLEPERLSLEKIVIVLVDFVFCGVLSTGSRPCIASVLAA